MMAPALSMGWQRVSEWWRLLHPYSSSRFPYSAIELPADSLEWKNARWQRAGIDPAGDWIGPWSTGRIPARRRPGRQWATWATKIGESKLPRIVRSGWIRRGNHLAWQSSFAPPGENRAAARPNLMTSKPDRFARV